MRQRDVKTLFCALTALVLLWASPALSSSSAQTAQLPESGPGEGDANWIYLEATPQPAYVGIHGGTAPMTLVRTKNGEIVALTGETGSDFTRLILGHNASRNSASGSASRPSGADADELQQNALLTCIKLAPMLTALTETAARGMQAKTAPATANRQEQAKPAQASTVSPVDLPVVLADSIAEKPVNYPSPVFANEGGTPSLDSSEALSFYGMSLADNPPAILVAQAMLEPAPDVAFVPSRPLKLHDYRTLLSLRQ